MMMGAAATVFIEPTGTIHSLRSKVARVTSGTSAAC